MMQAPRGIITVKESFELSNLCDKKFHKMAQNFSMIAKYGQHNGKTGSAAAPTTKQLEENYMEREAKNLRVQASEPKEATKQEAGTPPT
jgi:hypothetical protein